MSLLTVRHLLIIICLITANMASLSTMLQLLRIMDEWTEYLESDGQINVIYADFEKAFDKVSHKLLIRKLRYYTVNESLGPNSLDRIILV